ncbi:hypothetical protein SERLADRAFT_364217 [Serpula lacrymans var. lacrymans S7.9]|uniref:Major facilitator superfamily (MFS) profile domain-containing protein n=1 Tax=Serpula lacrymans var. lacrymans (strain S7.9) TaxID=578457 RepID=F8PDC6_SERL9|nr:uncharacterized protein SERLADRAFT_364217 [Serpula lacrymans var. lacrymans S7.9]EGO18747.1 hypothetical protein SERLADRAFT_364217 [Serpula lacrymans var. lacrymans S7.9]
MHPRSDSFDQPPSLPPNTSAKRDWRFWLIFLSLTVSFFNTALELCSVSTALPTIVDDLHGTQFVWVGSAYALAATAFVPLSGSLAEIWGRKPVMLSALIFFAIGSTICGSATSLGHLIIGRAIQGVGGGGIAALSQIILSDLVPLHERGLFNGMIGLAWSLASGIGPVVGGALAQRGQWRWLFYLNVPFCAVAGLLVLLFLKLRAPSSTLREKWERMDWLGNFIVIASTTSCIIALTWGGVQYPWSSARVLVPLILGLVGLFVFIVYESYVPKYPMIPFSLLSTVTGASGFLQTFVMPILLICIVYYLPVYFQACKGASPVASGVDGFGIAFTVAPSGVIAGITVTISRGYRIQLWTGWVIAIIGLAMISTLHADSSRGIAIGFQIIAGVGIGIISTTTYFPVLAPLPVSSNASALALFTFLRNFAQVWGLTIGDTILQNAFSKRLPDDFTSVFPLGTAIAYSVIPLVSAIEEPLKSEVRVAFADSLCVLWQVLIGVAGLGLLVSLVMKALPLHTSTDKEWGVNDSGSDKSLLAQRSLEKSRESLV